MSLPFHLQPDSMDCGPTCVRIISSFYKKHFSIDFLRRICKTGINGTSLLALSEGSEKIGFKTLGVKINPSELNSSFPTPCIAHFDQNHFVVVYKIKNDKIIIADPAHGILKLSRREFIQRWLNEGIPEGVILLFEPTAHFYTSEELHDTIATKPERKFIHVFGYLKNYRHLIFQLLIGILASSILQLAFRIPSLRHVGGLEAGGLPAMGE